MNALNLIKPQNNRQAPQAPVWHQAIAIMFAQFNDIQFNDMIRGSSKR